MENLQDQDLFKLLTDYANTIDQGHKPNRQLLHRLIICHLQFFVGLHHRLQRGLTSTLVP
jgi:hypothetical protein